MKMYLKNRLISAIFKRTIVQIISVVFLFIALFLFIFLLNNSHNFKLYIIIVMLIAVIVTAISFKQNFKLKFKDEDKELLKIIVFFLRMNDTNIDNNQLYILEMFKPYNKKKFFELLNIYKTAPLNPEKSMNKIVESNYDLKLFLVETLLDICFSHGIITISENHFISKSCKLIGINNFAYENIKYDYVKKGMKEEGKFFSTGNGNNEAESTILMNAFKQLEVTPDVTYKELKNAYRSKVKKYHPDRYHGEDENTIQETQIQFHEVTKAYELIMKHKSLSGLF